MTEAEFFAIHVAQSAEWQAIKDEMVAAWGGEPTAHRITTEQRKRMLARGERLLILDDIQPLPDWAKAP